jgi:hypothetical protein
MQTHPPPSERPEDSPSVPGEDVREPPLPAPGQDVREPPPLVDRPQERLPGDDEVREPGDGGEGEDIKRKRVTQSPRVGLSGCSISRT